MAALQTLIFVPLFAAMAARLLARLPRFSAALGVVTAGGLWLWLRALEPTGTAVVFAGQPMALTEENQAQILLLLLGFFLLFGFSILLPSGEWFVGGGLLGFTFLAGGLLVRPFSVAMALFLLAAGAFSLTIQSGQAGSVKGSLRYLLAALLAVPLLLIVAWQIETQPADWLLPPGELAALASLMLLAGFPFHYWVLAVANEARPLPLVLITGMAPFFPLILLLQYFAIHPNLLNASFQQLVWLSSGLTLLAAGVLALTAVNFRRFIGSLLLLNMALTLLVLTLPEQTRLEAAAVLQIGRFLSLLLLAAGWGLLQRDQADWPINRLPTGAGRGLPLKMALFGLGLFSLLGVPFSLGFAGQWRVLTAAAETAIRGGMPWWLPALALLALGLGAAGVFRVFAALLSENGNRLETAVVEPIWLKICLGVILAVSLWLALSPQFILDMVLTG